MAEKSSPGITKEGKEGKMPEPLMDDVHSANSFLRSGLHFFLVTSLPERLLFSIDSCWQRCDSLSFPSILFVALGSSFLQSTVCFTPARRPLGKITKMTKIFLVFLASLYTLHLITQLKSLS